MKTVIIIPARWKSKRFPGKPLAKINNKELIHHVWDKANKVKNIDKVLIATDDKRIANFCNQNHLEVIMTSKKCKTGTDRVFEVSKKINADIYVNVQGDEPLVKPGNIEKIIVNLKKNISNGINVSTGYTVIKKKQNKNFSNVYLIKSKKNEVIYVSRKELPFIKSKNFNYFKHIGIFAFTKKSLNIFSNFGIGALEKSENIELLRFIENNIKVTAVPIKEVGLAVDYKSDIKQIENYTKKRNRLI